MPRFRARLARSARTFLPTLVCAAATTAVAAPSQPARCETEAPAQRVLAWTDRAALLLDLQGDRFRTLHTIALRAGLAGAPRIDRSRRRAFFMTDDGWVMRVDLDAGSLTTDVRAGVRSTALALAANGRFLALANAEPPGLVLLDAELNTLNTLDGRDADRKHSAAVTTVHDATARRSFVAALPGLPELWEVSYDPEAPDIAAGLVHDFRLREGTFVRGFLNPRRTRLEQAFVTIFVDPAAHEVLIADAGGRAQAVHLEVRRPVAAIEFSADAAAADLASASALRAGKMRRLFAPLRGTAGVARIDANGWQQLAPASTAAPVRATRARPMADQVWLLHGAPAKSGVSYLGAAAPEASGLLPLGGGDVLDLAFNQAGNVLFVVGDHGRSLVALDPDRLCQFARLRASDLAGALVLD